MHVHPVTLEFGWPGDGGIGLRLIDDILAGRKTATCCPVAACTREEMAAMRAGAGQLATVVDRLGKAHCNVRVLEVFETPWGSPDPRVVRGEGYDSADAWRDAMSYAWRHLVDSGELELRDDSRILVELFELVGDEAV